MKRFSWGLARRRRPAAPFAKISRRRRIGMILAVGFLIAGEALALPIGKIEIEGAASHPDAIRSLLDTREGEEFDPEEWRRDIQRIKNTELFYDAQGEARDEGGVMRLRLALKNKHSLLPILKYKQGGGISFFTAGLYEVNFLERLLEVGAQYENLNGRSGGVAWFRHPYFLSRKNHLGTELYIHTVNLPLLTLDGEEEASFYNREVRWNGRFLREWSERLRFGMELSLYENVFERDDATPEQAARNALFASRNDLNSGLTVSITPRILFGRLNKEEFYVEGSELTLQTEIAQKVFGSDFNFVKGQIQWIGGLRPSEKINLVAQFQLGSKRGREFQHKFYLGGLDTVRGFLDGQLRGDHFWLVNLELRPTLLNRPLWVLQGNFFTDWSKTWDAQRFSAEGFRRPYFSYGAGVRVILPRVYRALLRVDFARTQEPIQQFGLSLGLQQFF